MTLEAITDYLASIGCEFPEIGLLQPADPFLDTIGEDLRRRIFITSDNSGETLCLRPEFTVPVCQSHLTSGALRGRYAYSGKVFRQRETGTAEFLQAGYEDLGNPERSTADIACIQAATSAVASTGEENLRLVIGDQAMFESLTDGLDIPPAWKKRLSRSFGEADLLQSTLDAMVGRNGHSSQPEELTALAADQDVAGVSSWIREEMLQDGLPLTGGRTPDAIAERLIDQFELKNSVIGSAVRDSLEQYLSISGAPQTVLEEIEALEKSSGLDLSHARANLAELFSGISDLPVDIEFRASFGRRLDYYTGVVFELYRPGEELPVSGGGRYDRLLTLLGSPSQVPAVGFSIWVDRLLQRVQS